ncbi:MAG: DUF4923 family protein [Bacteroidales bacterium]|nr:DUF4923 family protein [Bacteroidales bacterium]
MKKIIVAILAIVLAAGTASAQGSLLDKLKGIANEAASQVLGSVIKVSLPGTWVYQGCAVDVTAGDKVSTIAANAAMVTVEEKADNLLAKGGIKAGVATFVFNEDGTFSLVGEKKAMNGTYTYDQESGNVVLKFGKLLNVLTMEGVVKLTTDGCEMLFDADKFLSFVKKVLTNAKVKNYSETLSTLAPVIESLTGADIGFKLKR